MIGTIKIVSPLKTETVNGVANVVTQVNWYIHTVTDNYELTLNGGVANFAYDPDAPFVQFADLDEATVVGWVQSSLSADELEFWNSFEQRELAYYDDIERHGVSRQVTAFATYTPQDNGVQAAPWERQAAQTGGAQSPQFTGGEVVQEDNPLFTPGT